MSDDAIDLAFFHESGFTRKECKVTGQWFWSRDPNRETAGDTIEDEYTFIGSPIFPGIPERGRDLKHRMRETFLNYFEEHGHGRVDPYPVIARWRDDIYLTIASIADFQPHVTSGLAEPPANPLAVSQPCIRLLDIGAVGRSGRHLTTFEMMGHHSFNKPLKGEVHYWMEECVAYCDELFVDRLGVDPMEVTYVENPWSGGGNAGPALEVIVGGLELATLVFMNLEEHPDGAFEIKGERYREMELQVIDTGYGLERFCWAAAGTPTIYEAIYPETVKWLKELSGFDEVLNRFPHLDIDRVMGELAKLSGIMNIELKSDVGALRDALFARLEERDVKLTGDEFHSLTWPLERIYGITDHLHALTHMVGDGLVPSNAKAGYLARMIARRCLRMRDDLGLEVSLADLVERHIEVNMDMELQSSKKRDMLSILDNEELRYREMLARGEAVVKTAIQNQPKDTIILDDDTLFFLNDAHGLAPDMVVEIGHRLGWESLKLREGLTVEFADRHAKTAKKAQKAAEEVTALSEGLHLPKTEKCYYDDVNQREFSASVLAIIELDKQDETSPDKAVILNRTLFYPEGGGQECDLGIIQSGECLCEVVHVSVEGEYILHHIRGTLEVGDLIDGRVDDERRRQLMDHHTAVHIVGGAARKLLGPHIYQAGASKSVDSARLDITHHKRLTEGEMVKIEIIANQTLSEVESTEKMELDRKDADRRFGFDLYQGGAPKGAKVRILRIGSHDVQACGGTHHDRPADIGMIRVIRSTLVQDGVERLHIVAGAAALRWSREQDALLREASDVLGVTQAELPRSVRRFFEEWKSQRKTIESLESEITRLRTSGGGDDGPVTVDGVRQVVMEVDGDLKQMQRVAGELTRDADIPTVSVLGSRDGGGKLLVAITEKTVAAERFDAGAILRLIAPHIGGGGGGRPTFAQGGGKDATGIPSALAAAKAHLNPN